MQYYPNWYISYADAGGKIIKEVGGPSKRVAQAVLGKKHNAIAEGRYLDKTPMTPWQDAVNQFRAWFKVNTAPATAEMYHYSLKVLDPFFNTMTLDKVTPPMIEHFKSVRLSQGLSPATVNRNISTIKRLFSLSEDWGMIEGNKMDKVKMLSEKTSKRTDFLSETQIEALLQECRHIGYLHMIVLIALETGLRKGAILKLKWKDIDFDRGMLRVLTKGDVRVSVPLSDRLKVALRETRLRSKVITLHVVANDLRQEVKVFKDAFKGALRRAGIPQGFRFHDLRHTFASHFLIKTRDLKALQEILGHSDIKMTMRYAHLLDEHKKDAMAVFDQARQGAAY
jgi:integrase